MSRIPNNLLPQTPGPKRVDEIQHQLDKRFAAMTIVQEDPNQNLDDYFIEYDYYEEYDENKPYSRRTYSAVYKQIMREYQNHLVVFHNEKTGMERHYVAAKQLPNEIDKLIPYCPCITCTSFFLNPIKYIFCPHCTQCLKSGQGFASKEYIQRAQIRKEQGNKRMIQLRRYPLINLIRENFLRITEILVFLMIVLFFVFR